MHREAGVEPAGQIGGAGHQLVGRQIVADEGHPPLDQAAARVGGHHRRLALEHLRRGRGERPDLDVPAPRADGASDADGLHGLGHTVGVGDGAGFDDRGGAVAEALDGGQRGRHLVVVGRVGAVQRHRPLEDRGARRQQVGDAALHQRVAGEVFVGVDHAGRDDAPRRVEDLGVGPLGEQRARLADGDDVAGLDGDGATEDHLAYRVHRDDVASGYEQFDRLGHGAHGLGPSVDPCMAARYRAVCWSDQ